MQKIDEKKTATKVVAVREEQDYTEEEQCGRSTIYILSFSAGS